MIGIAWRMVRRQMGTMLGAFVMAAVGAVLVTGFLAIQVSIHESRIPVERYGSVKVAAAGAPGTITAAMVRDLESIPGVQRAVPELSFPATLLDAQGRPVVDQADTAVLAHGWDSASLTPITVSQGREPTGDDVLLTDALAQKAGVSVGDLVHVRVGASVHSVLVAGIGRPGGDWSYQHGVYFAPQRAADLAQRGADRVDAVGLFLRDTASARAVADEAARRIEAALGGDVPSASGIPVIRVAAGADLSELEGALPDQRASAQAVGLLVWIIGFMAVAVVAGALVTSVRRRARQFALLRAIGATPVQVRLLCQAEAAFISLAAAVIGGVGGLALAGLLLRLFRSLGVVTPTTVLHPSPAQPTAGAVLVLVIGQAAAWFAARSALRARPAEALTGTGTGSVAVTRRRTWLKNTLGLLLLVGAGAVQLAGMRGLVPDALRNTYGMLASLLIMVGITAIGSSVVHLLARLARPPVARVSPTSGFLAASNVSFHHRRYAGVAAPLAVGVALAGWALSGLPLFARANADLTVDGFHADHILASPMVRETYLGLTEQDRARLAAVDGVGAAAGIRHGWAQATTVDRTQAVRSPATWATTVTGPPSKVLALGLVRGDLAALDAGTGVAVGSDYARRQGLDVGTQTVVRVAGATHPVRTRVVAVFDHDAGGDQSLVIPEAVVADAAGHSWYETVLLADDGSRAAPALAQAVHGSGLSVQDPHEFRASYVQQRADAVNSLGTIAVALAGLFLVVASANALALSAADRRAELASLQRLNASRRQVVAMIAWEMLLTVGPAWLLGMLATAWMALAMAGGSITATLWAYPWAELTAMGAVGLILAVGGSLLATRAFRQPARAGEPRS